jgi:hypothetical protein
VELLKKLGNRPCKTGTNQAAWGLFLCPSCSTEVEKVLQAGKSALSCGCSWRDNKNRYRLQTTHGLRSHPLYSVWVGMKRRCCDSRRKEYADYGGRGISVCSEWVEDVKAFIDWSIRNGWSGGLVIDRINNDLNYSPDNCRFVSVKDNNRNKRNVTCNQVTADKIRAAYRPGVVLQRSVGLAFGVHRSTVSDIINNKIWVREEVRNGRQAV